jgi:hypothetical protein
LNLSIEISSCRPRSYYKPVNDITIFYQGGSGGFALYYYLLLSGEYQYDIPEVKQMISQQFPATLTDQLQDWKMTEFWPDNRQLKTAQGKKLFLICNPLFNPGMYETNKLVSSDTHKILLYTDIHLQLRMAYDKQAYWFTPVSRKQFNAPDDIRQYLRQIINAREDYRDIQVDPIFLGILEEFSPDQLVRLEDFVKSAAINNFAPPNQDQRDFLNHWRSLQSPRATHLIEEYYRTPLIIC